MRCTLAQAMQHFVRFPRPPRTSQGLWALLLASWSWVGWGQTAPDSSRAEVVQVSGLVVTGDSLAPLPYCTVFRARDRRGTMTNLQGFFSLPALVGDTLEFSSVGYTSRSVVIPGGSDIGRVNLVQTMGRDTVNMADAFVYPWPSKERFRQEFLALGLPNEGLVPRWEVTMDPMDMYDRLTEFGRDGQSTATQALATQAQIAAYAGQAPPVNLLNPVAWAKFLQALKAGELQRQ